MFYRTAPFLNSAKAKIEDPLWLAKEKTHERCQQIMTSEAIDYNNTDAVD